MAEHENVQRLRTGYDAFAKGDLETIRGLFADDIVWHVSGDTPISGDYKGVEEVFGYFGRLLEETGGSLNQDIHDMLANDQHGVVLVRTSAERNGKSLTQNVVHIFHFNSEGKTTEFWAFAEDSAAIDDFWS